MKKYCFVAFFGLCINSFVAFAGSPPKIQEIVLSQSLGQQREVLCCDSLVLEEQKSVFCSCVLSISL